MRPLSSIGAISALTVWLGCAAGAWAVPLLTPGDFIVAIDPDSWNSKYRAIEGPANVCDGSLATKYLNYGTDNSGFIVTPAFGPSVVQSVRLTTANDREERDPASFELYGTNAPIASVDDSDGTGEPWIPIAWGPLNLPTARFTAGPVVNFSNGTSFTSYKVIFPTVKRNTSTVPNSMQICEVEIFTGVNATGWNVLGAGGSVLAIDRDLIPQSSSPAGEGPAFAIDNRPNKYLNHGRGNSGFIATPWVGATVVTAFQIMTANDNPSRDPLSYVLHGTNDSIRSEDNSNGDQENWALIASGELKLPTDRITWAPAVMISNSRPFTSYRIVFPTLRDALATDSMQIGEIQFYGTIITAPPIPLLNPGDPILAIDSDTDVSASFYPALETPAMACDGIPTTKYLNFAKENSGLIVAPVHGPSVVQSLRLTTGNDSPERDPTAFELHGANTPIASHDNSRGLSEPWTLIASGVLAPPIERSSPYPVVNIANTVSFSSYKILFPALRESAIADSMQVTEIELFTGVGGAGTNVLQGGGMFLAIDADIAPASSYPAAEGPAAAIDRTLAKYLNFGKTNAGFIVKPSAGRTIVNALHLTSANDHADRDPMTWTLYGTVDPVLSTDNSQGTSEKWTLITSGPSGVGLDRQRLGAVVSFTNTTPFDAYRLIFNSLREGAEVPANSVQVSEVQFYGTIVDCSIPFADTDGDRDVDQVDFGAYQSCFTGEGTPNAAYECRCLDRDKDGDIDIADFAEFEKCVTGPAIAWTQALKPDCVP